MAVRPRHLENISRVKGKILCAGGLLDAGGKMKGSVLIIDFAGREFLDEYLKSEPYILEKVWERVEVEPMNVVVLNGELQQAPKAAEKITISKKPTIKKPTATKSKITVNWKHFKHTSKKAKAIWKKIKKVQVQCATDSGFKNIVKTVPVGKGRTKAVIKGLSKGTTYYVRVRYFDGTGYSNWSKVKRRERLLKVEQGEEG